jgi:amino acid adenylation domain-containing protein
MSAGLLQDYLARAVERTPEAPALAMGEERLTYAELERESNQLARGLREAGCDRGDRVCLLLPKSPAAIVAILATIKADCVYVPIDVESPAARSAAIVESCTPRLVLIEQGTVALGAQLAPSLPADAALAAVDDPDPGEGPAPAFAAADWHRLDAAPLAAANTPDDLAYLFFTSGSTGVPKGVGITHSNVTHFTEWALDHFGITAGERLSGHPPLHFDLSTLDIYCTLAAGAELWPVPPEVNGRPAALLDFIRDAALNQWHSVPSALTFMAGLGTLVEGDLPALRRVLWCGEALPTTTLIHWMRRLPHAQFTNLYGPTEATIASSHHRVVSCPEDPTDPIPIGVACGGEEILVLDESMARCAPEEIGDLYIGGVGLSPGYWRDPEKTAAAFVPHPFATEPGARLYRTGDLARLGTDGLVYFVGRADSQIKHRGYRIELGEIEVAIGALAAVDECAVVAVPTEGFEGTAICCAYVATDELAPEDIKQGLLATVPAYMVPARWARMAELPATANGKIDRKVLRASFEAELRDERAEATAALDAFGAGLLDDVDRGVAESGRAADIAAAPPGTRLADDLAARPRAEWREVMLALVGSQLTAVIGSGRAGIGDPERTFEEIGVDSHAAVELRNRLGGATGLRLPATLVFDRPTAAAVADYLLARVEGGGGGGEEDELREAIASIPIERLRQAGLLEPLLELAGVGPDAAVLPGAELDEMAVEDLVQRALETQATQVDAG